ncbi:MAG: enoyl-CoA hydratase [Candidatus Protistobacter heckmanni]|nr:enoyl-CoA hydratase [Candidatus Protistobacter heckmanni]
MTWHMYERLGAICDALAADKGVRVAVFRGAGGKAFVAGTDIEQFKAFKQGQEGGADGVAYEARIDAAIERLETLPFATVAAVEGYAVGGGLAIATACDFRIAAPGSRLGAPIARTVGNCLSPGNVARLAAAFGHARVKRMLLLAELLGADEALTCCYLLQIVEPAVMEDALGALCAKLSALAPLTQYATKETLRCQLLANLPDCSDLIRLCYGSGDFRRGIEGFVSGQAPKWKGE